MEIYACGITVRTKLNNIEGVITAVVIRFDACVYELSYFSGFEYKQIWITESEFNIINDEKKEIGFRN